MTRNFYFDFFSTYLKFLKECNKIRQDLIKIYFLKSRNDFADTHEDFVCNKMYF
jgi:hypothetical protein